HHRQARRRDVERALQQVPGVGEELLADRARRNARPERACAAGRVDGDLLPADAAAVVGVAIGDPASAVEVRPGEDDLEPRRAQPCLSRWEREPVADRDECRPSTVDGQPEARCDRASEPLRVRLAALGLDVGPGLERRDLRLVEHVEDVEAVARRLDPAVPVDREVADRVSQRIRGKRERAGRHRDEKEDELRHSASLRATGDHSTEKWGFNASALPSHTRLARVWPRQRSIIPRWKNLSASRAPSLSARCEYPSASTQRPFRASAHARTSSPSIDGRSARATRARSSACRSAIPWSIWKREISRSVLTPFAFSSRSIAPISAYWRLARTGLPVAR